MAQAQKAALADFDKYLYATDRAILAGKPNLISVGDLRIWLEHFGQDVVEQTIIPRRTLMRRKARREKLTADETDKAMRVARISLHAERVFHGFERAHGWLTRPLAKFSGQSPLDLLKTESGGKLVEQTLGQIEHGMFG